MPAIWHHHLPRVIRVGNAIDGAYTMDTGQATGLVTTGRELNQGRGGSNLGEWTNPCTTGLTTLVLSHHY